MNNTHLIKQKLPQIAEYFVKYYGEQYRERIEKRFNNIVFVFDRASQLEKDIKENEDYLAFVGEKIQNGFLNIFAGADEKYIKNISVDLYFYLKAYSQLTIDEKQDFIKIYKNLTNDENLTNFDSWRNTILDKLARLVGKAILSKKIKIRSKLKEQFDNEVYKELEEKDIFSGKYIYEFLQNEFLDDPSTGALVAPTIKSSNFNEPVFVCGLSTIDQLDDQILVHELNHIFDTDIVCKGEKRVIKTNCLIREFKINKSDNTLEIVYNSSDKMMNINEIFNDYIATEIVELMHKDGFKIFDKPTTCSAYSSAFPAVKDFIENNKQLISSPNMNKPQLLNELLGDKLNAFSHKINEFLNYDLQFGQKVLKELCTLEFGAISDQNAQSLDFDKLIGQIDENRFSKEACLYLKQIKEIKKLLEPFKKKSNLNDNFNENDLI